MRILRIVCSLLVFSLWVGLADTVGAAGLLNGATASSFTTPPGWTAIVAQGFETGTVPSTQFVAGSNSAPITSAFAHTGTRSIGGTILADSNSYRWGLRQGNHTSKEIYMSYWKYMTPDGSFNDEMIDSWFEIRNASTGNYQTVRWEWFQTGACFGRISGQYNSPAGLLVIVSEGVGPGKLHNTRYNDGFCPATAPELGAWAQYEIHYRANTPGNSDGFFVGYINGVQRVNVQNVNLNGSFDMTGMFAQAGGTYTRHVWRDFTTNACGAYIGDGSAVDKAGFPVSNFRCIDFNNCSCPPNTDPFEVYFDDIIVMVPSGTTPPGDTMPPSTPSGLTASVLSGTSATYDWNASTDNVGVTSYTVRRCTGAGCTPSTVVATVTSPTTIFTDNGLAAATTYNVAVAANDAAGYQSSFSPRVEFTTSGGGGSGAFRTTTFTDDFNRANTTNIGSVWDNGYLNVNKTNLEIISNQVRHTATNTSDPKGAETVNSPSFANDQWCQITLGTFTGSEDREAGCLLRAPAPTTINWYWCYARKTATNAPARNSAIVSQHPGGVGDTNLASDFTTVWGSGDKLRCEAQGTTLRLFRIPAGTANDTLVLSVTDSEFTAGRPGLLLWMNTGGTLANMTVDDFAAGEFATAATGTITFDAGSDSAATNTTNTISWTHTVGSSCANNLLVVGTQARDDAALGDVAVSSITYRGQALTKIRADSVVNGSGGLGTELWYLVNPGSGSGTVTTTWAGALSRVGVGSAISLCGVDQNAPLDAHNGANASSGTTISASVTTVAANAWIVDTAIARPGETFTVGAGQTARTNREVGATVGAALSTVNGKASPGAETMDWTKASSGHWTISAASFKPAAATPVVPPTITEKVCDSTGCTLTYGPTTPSFIRVDTDFLTEVKPISDFPSARYTPSGSAWQGGTTFVCFTPRDATSVENPAGSQCANLVGIAPVLDTVPPVLSNGQPSSTLPAGTTSWTFSVEANEPISTCRFAATDLSYIDMGSAGDMTVVGLTASAPITGLTNGSSTPRYIRCQDQASPPNTMTSSFLVTITVASSTADTTPPSTVTNLACAALSATQAECTWTAATDNVAVAGYQISAATGACATYTLAGNPVPATTVLVGLQPSTTHCWTVRAIDTSQNLSAADSNIATITTTAQQDTIPPQPMTGLRALLSPFTHSVFLEFDEGIDNLGPLVATIEQAPAGCTAWQTVSSSITTQQLIVSLQPGTSYCFRGIWTDAAGNRSLAYSDVLTLTTATTGLRQPRLPLPLGSARTTAPARPPRP